MTEQPAVPEELTDKAFELIDKHQSDGRNDYGYDQCECGWVAFGGAERWADHLVHVLAAAGLFAVPVQQAELERLRTEVEQLTDFAGEQSNARRQSDRVRNFAAREAADLRDELATSRHAAEDARERHALVVSDRDELSIKLDDVTEALQGDSEFKAVLVNPAVDKIQALFAERNELQLRIAHLEASVGHHATMRGDAVAEREQAQARIDAVPNILRQHYLAWIECDHDQKMDNPQCACSKVDLGWHPTVGDAVNAWIEHVRAALQADQPAAPPSAVDSGEAPAKESGQCPNDPRCVHPASTHDVSGDPEDPKPMCCADGCTCGQPGSAQAQFAELRAKLQQPAVPSTPEAT